MQEKPYAREMNAGKTVCKRDERRKKTYAREMKAITVDESVNRKAIPSLLAYFNSFIYRYIYICKNEQNNLSLLNVVIVLLIATLIALTEVYHPVKHTENECFKKVSSTPLNCLPNSHVN